MNTTAFTPGPEWTIACAASLRDSLLQAVQAADADLTLALSDVTDFDSAGVQLLLATQRSLGQRGHALWLLAPSPAVCAGLATFGLQDLLPLAPDRAA